MELPSSAAAVGGPRWPSCWRRASAACACGSTRPTWRSACEPAAGQRRLPARLRPARQRRGRPANSGRRAGGRRDRAERHAVPPGAARSTSGCCRYLRPRDGLRERHQGPGERHAATDVGGDPGGRLPALSAAGSGASPDPRSPARWRAGNRPPWWSPPPTAALAEAVQDAFSGPTFRLYTSADPVGVEIGGAVKNVVAIGAGVLPWSGAGQQRHGRADHPRAGGDDPPGGGHGRAAADAGRSGRAWATWC